MQSPLHGSKVPDFLRGGGEAGALMRGYDWSASPLGVPERWPQPLKTLIGVMLTANQPMFVAWGGECTLLYNDSYAEVLGNKHPSAFGRDFLEVWAEISADLTPIVQSAYAGEPVHMDDIELWMERKGHPEETHFTFSYTPIHDESGEVAGFFCPCVEITEQVLADRRRAQDAERQRRLFEQAPGFITILAGPEHVFEFANAAYLQAFGNRDVVGKTVREAFPELGDQGFFQLLDRVYATGERFVADHIPIRLVLTPGQPAEERFLDFIYEPVVDEDGRVTGIFVEGYDVTSAHRAEAELRASEARLSFLDQLGAQTASLADADAVLATTTRLLGKHLNLSVCAYADMDEDQDGFTIRGDWAAPGSPSIVGHYRLADFGKLAVNNLTAGLPLIVNDNLRELAPEEAATFQALGISATICMPLVKEGRLAALMAIHDRVPRVWSEAELGLLREVTERSWAHVERVAAMVELRASEARYRTLFDTVDAGFCVVELLFDADERPVDYRFVEANPAFERQTGLVDAVGRTARELVPDLEPHWFELYGGVALTGESVRFEQGAIAMGRWFDVHALRVGDPLSRRVAILFHDISDRRAAEERLRELNETLESRVAERTVELEHAYEQLRQSQKLEAMGQLTGGVAHDFNNLLTPIVGALDMLHRRGFGSDRERRLIDGAMQSAERARVLVQRLLAFARRQPLQTQAVDVRALVEGMADLVASTSGPRIKLLIDVADDLPSARADANQVEMAILNLAVNARDAMPEGGTLTISLKPAVVEDSERSEVSAGSYVLLSVADSGLGMDEATLKRAIEPFFSTKGVGRGTGLGLSMVHGLASQLGGGLAITSKPGLGTCVELYLPAADEAAEPTERAEDSETPRGAGTALLVDDEEFVRASTADMLTELGYEVVEASSAEEALRLVDRGLAPDLLVTDHLMPGQSGTDLAHELRGRWRDLPMLLVSGYAEAEGVAPDLARLVKPFRQADLAAKLAELDPFRSGESDPGK
jgi:PAS domain S-box-containing protein